MIKKSSLRILPILTALLFTVHLSLTNSLYAADPEGLSLIPKPVSYQPGGAFFELTANTVIRIPEGNPELIKVAGYLANCLNPATGYNLPVQSTGEMPAAGYIRLETVAGSDGDRKEGYELTVGTEGIIISANSPEGVFRGIQTLRQLLPAAIESSEKKEGPWNVPTCTVKDYPVYSYRGAMLDVARHFFGVNDVKRFIDLIAAYKMNILHLHLSDDQGWRIEIKAWPALTGIGSKTQVGGGKGGFYTQEEYRELVQYAADRYITVVPEIDMPGHTNAALASIPELNPDNKPTQLYTGTKVGFSTLQANKDFTYRFLNDVIRELTALTPGPYIHIGGDESHVTKKEDYIPFIEKVQDIVLANGKTMIGWDETTQASLKPSSIAQYWARAENAKRGVAKGVRLIMSPSAKAYLDMKYHVKSPLGLDWAGYIEVDTGYKWNPATLVPGITRENILGVECPLWSETVKTIKDIEFLVFPRLPGYAEIGWSDAGSLSWDEYKIRLGNQAERFRHMGINYYQSEKVPWK
jgi:hexosaminidase